MSAFSKTAFGLYLLASICGSGLAAEPAEERDFSREFGAYSGSFAFYDAAREHWLRYHPEQCSIRTTPCSTFDIMTLSQTGRTILRGKTGTPGDPIKDIATLGWFIGSVSTPSGDYFFATRVTGGENPSGRTARKITESILSTLKILALKQA